MASTLQSTLTIDQIDLSPLNVRTYKPDAEDTADLERSILAEGLLNPIAVHPMKGRKNRWGAIAGGRRRRAIRNLVDRGALPADWPVRVTHHDDLPDAELILLSLAENEPRRPLREHERAAGVARCAARGLTLDAIAAGLGRDDPADVARLLRLGNLAKPVFAALQEGRITIDQAKAYGAVEDAALQAAAFAALEQPGLAHHEKGPEAIRRWLKIGDRELARLLALVGEDTYRNAGGAFELDLFADQAADRGRIADEPLLRTLAEERFRAIRDDTRVTAQRADLRFLTEPPQNGYGGTDYTLQISADPAKLPDGDIVANITVREDGRADVSFWWASSSAKYGARTSTTARSAEAARKSATSPKMVGAAINDKYSYQQQANAAVREEAGISADTTEALRNLRRLIMRAAIVEDARRGREVGLDYLVWSQLRGLIKHEPTQLSGAVHLHPAQNAIVEPDLSKETTAREVWDKALYDLSHAPFIALDDPVAAFAAYRAADPELQRLAAAVVAGMALQRSLNAPLLSLPIHDALAAELALDDEAIRELWAPSIALLDQIPTRQRLEIAEPFVQQATFAPWSRLKSPDLSRRVLEVLTGVAPDLRSGRDPTIWVHPLLHFTPPAAGACTSSIQEAAE